MARRIPFRLVRRSTVVSSEPVSVPATTAIPPSTIPISVQSILIFTPATTEPSIFLAQTTTPSDAVTEQLNALNNLVIRLLAQNQELVESNKKRDLVIDELSRQNQEQSLQIQGALAKIAAQESENKALTVRVSKHEDQIHYNVARITGLKRQNKVLKQALESQMLRIKGLSGSESQSTEESEEEQLERRTKRRSDMRAPPQSSSSA